MSQKSSLPPNPISHAGRQDPRHSHSVSGALSIVGGFIGTVFGMGASLLISRLADWGAAVGPGAVLFAVFFSALVGRLWLLSGEKGCVSGSDGSGAV